jgi:EAL domain-containing protein (putative c-di-GMP-specific phosphodiesterase class I)
VARLDLLAELRQALERDEFELHYQPIVDLEHDVVDHFEALVRWRHPRRGLLLPAEFLPTMEETGLVVPLGRWVVAEACRQLAEWTGTYGGAVNVSVNVSDREFWDGGLLPHILACLARHDLDRSSLTVEITENVVMRTPESAHAVLQSFHAAGIPLHIDDFATGHSSLHALRRFPVQALKIDRSFVGELRQDDRTADLVRIIVAMGRALGIDVVAEGVESADQLAALQRMGCHRAQGFWFTAAVDGAAAGALLGRPASRLRPDAAARPLAS